MGRKWKKPIIAGAHQWQRVFRHIGVDLDGNPHHQCECFRRYNTGDNTRTYPERILRKPKKKKIASSLITLLTSEFCCLFVVISVAERVVIVTHRLL